MSHQVKVILKRVGRIGVLALLLFVILFSSFHISGEGKNDQVNAQTGIALIGGLPLGGINVVSIPCICSLSMLLAIVPPLANPTIGGIFTFQLFVSNLYLWYQIFWPGAYMKGTYIPGAGTCYFLNIFPPSCVYISSYGEVTQLGTNIT